MITIKFIDVRRSNSCIERIFRYGGMEANLKVSNLMYKFRTTAAEPLYLHPLGSSSLMRCRILSKRRANYFPHSFSAKELEKIFKMSAF